MVAGETAGRWRWVQVGVLAAGLGAAVLGGAAVAHAAPGDGGDQHSSVSNSHGSSARSAAKTARAAGPSATRRPASARTVSAPAGASTASPGADRSTGASARTITTSPTASTTAPAAQQSASVAGGFVGPVRAAIIAAQAYIYGYPLMEYERVRQTTESLNTIYSLTSFANPDVDPIWKAIGGGKRPNTDTFYSLAELDLSGGPVVLSIPDMGDRYFSFQLTDPYTNVVGYIGSRTTGSGPGKYALVWSGGPQGDIPPDAQVVQVPYSSILMLGRTLAGDAADQQQAIALIDQYSLTPTGGSAPSGPQPKPGLAYLDAISAAMAANPPPARDTTALATLARIGVGPGLTVAGSNLGPVARLAADLAVKATAALLPALANLTQLVSAIQHQGWAIPDSSIGNFGTNYLLRAGVAQVGLIANTPDEAMYSSALLDSRLLPLNGCSSYELHFAPGKAPPSDAFWSVTVYDGDGNLVQNPENRYSISSSRPDELVTRPDGSIDIIFSTTDPGDPTANWLPIPAGSFGVYLRNYVPQQAALDGSWTPPGIQRL